MRTATLSAAALLAGSAMAVECSKGLHILVGRGTGEEPGLGESGPLAKNVSAAVPGSDVVAIDYPASFTDPAYDVSEKDGAQDVYDKVTQYHKDCPGHKMAYIGWSQGAQIAINAFCGAQGGVFGDKAPIPAEAVKDVVALALYGDPSFNHSAPYDKGTDTTTDGLFVRNGTGACSKFADKIVSYCDNGDIYCSGGENHTVHGMYVVKYPEQMKQFIVDRYDDATGSSSGSNSTDSNSTTTTTTGPSSTGSQTTPTSGSSGTPKSTSSDTPKNAAAGLSAGLAYAMPAALFVAAQMLL